MIKVGGGKLIFLPIILLGVSSLTWQASLGAEWETLPPDHWAYEEIRWLQSAGYLRDLNPSKMPYTRGQVAVALKEGEKPALSPARERFGLLEREFEAEMNPPVGWNGFAGGRLFAGWEAAHDADSRETGYSVLSTGVGNRKMGIHTSLRADRDLALEPDYRGKVWSDFAGLTESAYAIFTGEKQRWTLKIGRDHLFWGPGDDHLLLNQQARGLDQISFQIRWKWGEFGAFIGQVDDYEDTSGARMERFLSGHRLDLVPWKWLRLGISETLLFTGGFRLGSINPFLPYYGELVNENSEGNGLIGFDFNAYLADCFQIYGQLLLDDVQIERKTSSDLEPSEWGWLIACRWAEQTGFLAAEISYEGITNRTYNALEPRYRYLNYGLPLGSALGNDADRLMAKIACWLKPTLRLEGFWEYSRQGEGRITAPFDTTYLNYSLEEGYSEPFPSGTVQETHTPGLSLSALFNRWAQLEGWIGYDWVQNAGNIADNKQDGFRGKVSLNIRLDHLWKFE